MCFHIRVIERLVSFILHGEKSEALARSNAAPDGAMVLLHDVVQVSNGTAPASSAEFSTTLQLGDHLWIGRIPIYIDHPWARVAERAQRLLEEAFRSSSIPSSR